MGKEFNYFNFGPFLMQTKIEDALLEDIRADLGTVIEDNIDYKSNLVATTEQALGYSDELISKYQALLHPYIVLYLEGLMYTWRECKDDKTKEIEAISNNLALASFWANFQKKGEYNPIHRHYGDISFVLYVDVPPVIFNEKIDRNGAPNGSIMFFYGFDHQPSTADLPDTSRALRDCLNPVAATGSIKPVSGELLIFPSYLHHMVLGFDTDVTRVSLSGNYILRD